MGKLVHCQSHKKSFQPSGFTILELVIAVGLLGITVTSFLYSQTIFLKLHRLDNDYFIASNAIKSKLNELRELKRLGSVGCDLQVPCLCEADTLLYYNCTDSPNHTFQVEGLLNKKLAPDKQKDIATISISKVDDSLAQATIDMIWTNSDKQVNLKKETKLIIE